MTVIYFSYKTEGQVCDVNSQRMNYYEENEQNFIKNH